ncbi:MAG: dimethylarginine dimethylaminohydrolase [Pseudomonadota bacterium]
MTLQDDRPEGRSYRFSHALCRAPAPSVVDGLRAGNGPDPDFVTFRSEHAAYVSALEAAGAEVTVLEPLDGFPDSVFIEDDALTIGNTAILLRPGTPSRAQEPAALAPDLEERFETVMPLPGTGPVDGGDVLLTDDTASIGLSARTSRDGAQALGEVLGPLGYRTLVVETPPDILHFKTDCGLIGPNTVLATERLASTGCLDGVEIVLVVPGEDPCANAIRVNDTVILSAGFPGTAAKLRASGYTVTEVPTSQAALVDGGPSCMSLRFSPAV